MSDIVSEARSEFKETLSEAYEDARKDLEEKLAGKRVVLKYPKPYLGKGREPTVEGVVDSVEVGSIPRENVEFAVCVKLEKGEKWIDANEIEIVDSPPEVVSPSDVPNNWRHVNDSLPESRPTGDTSAKVEVYLDTGARKIDRYNFEENMWEGEMENLEGTGMAGEYVEYWKPLEPDPQIEGRYQTNER